METVVVAAAVVSSSSLVVEFVLVTAENRQKHKDQTGSTNKVFMLTASTDVLQDMQMNFSLSGS